MLPFALKEGIEPNTLPYSARSKGSLSLLLFAFAQGSEGSGSSENGHGSWFRDSFSNDSELVGTCVQCALVSQGEAIAADRELFAVGKFPLPINITCSVGGHRVAKKV